MNKSYVKRLGRDMKYNYALYLMAIPVVLWYLLFSFKPMYGVLMAFYEYRPVVGFEGSNWIGLKNFVTYLGGHTFTRNLTNTLTLSTLSLFISFPAAVLLALLLNEVRHTWFKKTIQTVTYFPHFVSLVVVCGMISQFTYVDGLFNDIVEFFGGERFPILESTALYRPIYVLSGIWKEIGWSSIIYLAALSAVDVQLYEAAKLDGAGRLKQCIHVTIPGILPTIVIRFIMNVGSLMKVGYEKTLLLYNPMTYEVSDIISTYMYRVGMSAEGGGAPQYGLGTAVDLFNSVVTIILVVMANKFSRKATENSLW